MRLYVDSEMLSWVEYNSMDNQLIVCFAKSKEVYSYAGVPNILFLEFVDQKNDSVGRWMTKNIISQPTRFIHRRLPKAAFE